MVHTSFSAFSIASRGAKVSKLRGNYRLRRGFFCILRRKISLMGRKAGGMQ